MGIGIGSMLRTTINQSSILLSGNGRTRLPNRVVSAGLLAPLKGHNLIWDYFPLRQFMHYTAPRQVWSPRDLPRLGDQESSPVAVHIWRAGGPSPQKRVLLACLLSIWAANGPPEDPQQEQTGTCSWCADGWG